MARPKAAKNVKRSGKPTFPKMEDTMLPKKSLFRVDEVAQYFNVSRSAVYLWIDHGILSAEKYKGVIRVSRESILDCRFKARFDPMA